MKLKYDSSELVFMQYIAGMKALGGEVSLVSLTKMIRSYNTREQFLKSYNKPCRNVKIDTLSSNVKYAKFLIEQFNVSFLGDLGRYFAAYDYKR